MGTIIDKDGIKLNVVLDQNQIIMLAVFLFLAFFAASLVTGLILNSIFNKK